VFTAVLKIVEKNVHQLSDTTTVVWETAGMVRFLYTLH